MSHSAGFLSNTGDVAGITTSYVLAQKVRLTGAPVPSASPPSPAVTLADGKARLAPQAAFLGHMEILVAVTAGAPTALTAVLYWDSACDHLAFGPGTINLETGLTTVTQKGGVVSVEAWFVAPSIQTTVGEFYLVLKTDAGTVTVKRVRLTWSDRR